MNRRTGPPVWIWMECPYFRVEGTRHLEGSTTWTVDRYSVLDCHNWSDKSKLQSTATVISVGALFITLRISAVASGVISTMTRLLDFRLIFATPQYLPSPHCLAEWLGQKSTWTSVWFPWIGRNYNFSRRLYHSRSMKLPNGGSPNIPSNSFTIWYHTKEGLNEIVLQGHLIYCG